MITKLNTQPKTTIHFEKKLVELEGERTIQDVREC